MRQSCLVPALGGCPDCANLAWCVRWVGVLIAPILPGACVGSCSFLPYNYHCGALCWGAAVLDIFFPG